MRTSKIVDRIKWCVPNVLVAYALGGFWAAWCVVGLTIIIDVLFMPRNVLQKYPDSVRKYLPRQ